MKDKCIICNSENIEKLKAEPFPFLEKRMFQRKIENGVLICCKDCGFIYSNFRPTKEESARYYKDYFSGEYNKERSECEPEFAKVVDKVTEELYGEKALNIRKNIMRKLFSRHFSPDDISNALDFGGGEGKLIQNEFCNAKTYVYDIQNIKPVDGVERIEFEQLNSKTFDFIMCNNMLEHLANPIDEINKLKNLMHEGSYLYIELPFEEFDTRGFANKVYKIHEHINFFSTKTLKKIFNSSEYTILENRVANYPELESYPPLIHFLVKQEKNKKINNAKNLEQTSKIKDKLQIALITYNRIELLEKTLNQILAENSPIKDLDITIFNNNSTDGTTELLEDYELRYPNVKQVKNNINLGGNANIVKAYIESLENKDYIWLLCDNDTYNFEVWDEVINAIEKDYDVILTRHCKNNISEIFHEANFVPSCIYKTRNINTDVIQNMYDNISNMFPHLAIMAKNILDNNRFYIVTKDIVNIGVNPGSDASYTRGRNLDYLPEKQKNMFWSVAFFNSIKLITDRKKQLEIVENLLHFHKNQSEFFKSIIVYNRIYKKNNFENLKQIFDVLGIKQKFKFLFIYLQEMLSFKDYKYWFIKYKEEWIDYLNNVNEQKYINDIARKFKNKKIILYGAGMFYEILAENYDLSKLNIIGISDKKFENSDETSLNGIPIIKPSKLIETEFDTLLFTLKLYEKLKIIFKQQGLNKDMHSLIKSSKKYVIRH